MNKRVSGLWRGKGAVPYNLLQILALLLYFLIKDRFTFPDEIAMIY